MNQPIKRVLLFLYYTDVVTTVLLMILNEMCVVGSLVLVILYRIAYSSISFAYRNFFREYKR